MKNLISLSLLFAFFLVGTFSNTSAQGLKIRVGIEAGPNIGGMSFPNFWAREAFIRPAPGFSVGGAAQIPISKTFSIRTGLSFEQKRFVFSNVFSDLQGANGTRDFLILPAMVRWSTVKPTKYFFQVGMYAGYLLRFMYANPNVSEEIQDVTEASTRIDAGISLGMGFDFPAGDHGIISVEWRNSMGGLNNRFSTDPDIDLANDWAFSSSILLGFAWQ